MREQIARLVCGLSLATVIALAWLFAVRHNPPLPATPPPLVPTHQAAQPAVNASPAQLARGQALFSELECTTCHSLRGQGNPRRPLDDVRRRRSPNEISDWITGTGTAASALSPAVLTRKQPYQALPPADLAALVALLCDPSPAAGITAKP